MIRVSNIVLVYANRILRYDLTVRIFNPIIFQIPFLVAHTSLCI
jgi:hypothetical protein